MGFGDLGFGVPEFGGVALSYSTETLYVTGTVSNFNNVTVSFSVASDVGSSVGVFNDLSVLLN